MDFEEAERSEPTQALELTEDDIKEDGIVPLRYVKFQNVNSVTVSNISLIYLPLVGGQGSIAEFYVPGDAKYSFYYLNFFNDLFIFILCSFVFCLHVCLFKDVRFPGPGVTDSCELLCWCWGLNLEQ